MEDRKYLALEELVVWSDNPRHGLQVSQDELSEQEVINILIDVVGAEKMYNLIADIFASKKLMGNVNPVVVQNGSKYYVYDGNRRVSALKILKDPSIVEDTALQARIKKLIDNQDVSFANSVFVYITNEEEALEIMDKTHIGEQQGVGMISWEPYQRDTSLNRRGKTLQYQYAFSVCKALGYTMKSFNKIAYTDIDRLFGSKPLRDFFKIDENDPDYSPKAEYIIGMLLKYKEEKGFRSFSRQFNTTSSTTEDAPITAFCEWAAEQEKLKKNFYFKTTPVSIFSDEAFSFEMLNLSIVDDHKQTVHFDASDLSIHYVSPNDIAASSVSTVEIGDWHVEIEYKGEKHSEVITIKQLRSPKIDFDTTNLFGQGNTIDLRKLIVRAIDGHEKDRKNEVNIAAVGQGEIVKDVFTANNGLGVYKIAYSFEDVTGAPYSVTKEIRIIDKANPLLSTNRSTPLLSVNGTYTLIDISEVVNKLVAEINHLDFENNICVISTSLRSLIELSFDELQTSGKLIFSSKGDLKQCIDDFKAFLLKGELARLCKQYKTELPSFNSEKNCIEQMDSSFLASYLNLATHKSIARIDITKIAEVARKAIAPILVYTTLILK